MITKEEYGKELDRLTQELNAMRAKLLEAFPDLPEEIKQWEPQGGDWYVTMEGTAKAYVTSERTQLFGVERPTKELAERAAKEMRIHNRLLAYRDEFCPDYEPDWSNGDLKYHVFRREDDKTWHVDTTGSYNAIGVVLFPQKVCEQLVEKLNSGEVVL